MGDKIRFKLRFSAVKCFRCGVTRQAGVKCPDCHLQPSVTEVNILLQHRRQAVQKARLARRCDVDPPEMEATELIASSYLMQLLDSSLQAITIVAEEDGQGVEQLESAARDISGLERWVSQTPELKPLACMTRTIKRSVSSIVRVFDLALDALAASNIAKAQKIESDFQRSWEDATDAIGDTSRLLERFERIRDSDNPCTAWLKESIQDDIFAAMARGSDLLSSNDLDANDPGTQLLAIIWNTLVSTISDVDAFWQVVSRLYNFLIRHSETISSLMMSDEFKQRYAEVQEDSIYSVFRAMQIKDKDPDTLRQQVTELLEDAHYLIEQPMKLYMGIVCACTTRQSFEQTQTKDVASLIDIAWDQSWCMPGIRKSRDLRNAYSHRNYRVSEKGIVQLSPTKHTSDKRTASSTMTYEELCDAVFSILEARGVMEIVLTSLFNFHFVHDMQNFSPFLTSAIIESCLGWREVQINTQDMNIVIIEALCGQHFTYRQLLVIAALVPYHNESELKFKLQTPDLREKEIRIPLDKYHKYSQAETGIKQIVSLYDLLLNTIIDNAPALDEIHAKRYIAGHVLECLADSESTFRVVRSKLGYWRDVAKNWGYTDLMRAIAGVIGWKASKQAGGSLPVPTRSIVHLGQIASQDVDPPDEWLFSSEL